MIEPKIKELLDKYDFVVIPSKRVINYWQNKLGDFEIIVEPDLNGEVCSFINHDSIHLI